MKEGDLVRSWVMKGHMGIIISQVDMMDRWLILWSDGYETIFWGRSLEVINESR